MEILSIVAFVAAGALIVYIVAGYPLLLSWLVARRARSVRKSFTPRTVSALIAVYNGEKYLAAKLRSLLDLDYPAEMLQIWVVSDGSTDRTEEIARSFGTEGVRLLTVPHGGKPAAINACLPYCKSEILLLTDVRQELAPDCLRNLVACFDDPTVGVVSAHLVIRQGGKIEEDNVSLYWHYESRIRGLLSDLDSIFGASGACYTMRRELAAPMPSETLLDDVYLPLAAFFKGFRLIVEKSAKVYDYPTGLRAEFRRKIRTLAGNYQILGQYPALLGPSNRMWLHYLSYKFARLMLPWLLIVIFITSFGLPNPWSTVIVGLQMMLYILAMLDIWVPDTWAMKRFSSQAGTVVAMVATPILGIVIFFVPAQKLWRRAPPSDRDPTSDFGDAESAATGAERRERRRKAGR